jgi:indole-3-glycerol phosphate synthase
VPYRGFVTILEEIINSRNTRLEREKESEPLADIAEKAGDLFNSGYRPVDFLHTFSNKKPFLIAEIKKSSPSKGLIRKDFDLDEIIASYKFSGHVNAISVLTEPDYFSGSYDYLKQTVKLSGKPVLMKDFIFDEYQIFKGFIAGASAILLIAAVLNDEKSTQLADLAHRLGMKVLFEIHTSAEYKRALNIDFKIIGINNRDLKTFATDIRSTIKILESGGKPANKVIISESGINSKEDISLLRNGGADGFLIGESFMKQKNIPTAIEDIFGESNGQAHY